jgi:hypothetical protein
MSSMDDRIYNALVKLNSWHKPKTKLEYGTASGYFLAVVDKNEMINEEISGEENTYIGYRNKLIKINETYDSIFKLAVQHFIDSILQENKFDKHTELCELLYDLDKQTKLFNGKDHLKREYDDYSILAQLFNDVEYKKKADELKKYLDEN